MSPTMGRPPSKNPKSERIGIRVTPAEKAEVMNASHELGLSLLELIQKGIEAARKE